jgi:hypothetical protein
MVYSAETFLDESILVVTYSQPFDPAVDTQGAMGELLALMQKAKPPYYNIADVRKISLTFSDVVNGMATLRQNPNLSDVNFLSVGSGELLELGAKAIAQAQYGGHKESFIFESPEAALAWIRQHRANTA